MCPSRCSLGKHHPRAGPSPHRTPHSCAGNGEYLWARGHIFAWLAGSVAPVSLTSPPTTIVSVSCATLAVAWWRPTGLVAFHTALWVVATGISRSHRPRRAGLDPGLAPRCYLMVQVELPIPRERVCRVGDHAGPGSSGFNGRERISMSLMASKRPLI